MRIVKTKRLVSSRERKRNQRGGALQRKRRPSTVDKVGCVLFNFVTAAPTFKAFQVWVVKR